MTTPTEAAEAYIGTLPASVQSYARVYMAWVLSGQVAPAPERRSKYADHPGMQVGNGYAESVEKSICAALSLPWVDVPHKKSMPVPERRGGLVWPYGRGW